MMSGLERAAVRMVPWVQAGDGRWVEIPHASAQLFRAGLQWVPTSEESGVLCLQAEMEVFYSEDRRLIFRAFRAADGQDVIQGRLESVA